MKKKSPIMIVHMIMLIAMILCSAFATVKFIVDASSASDGTEKFYNLTHVALMLVILTMLIMGSLYLLNDYSKKAASYYKAFLLLHVVVCVITIFVDLYFGETNTFYVSVSLLYALRIIVLLALLFWKDLGQKRTWILFYALLVIGFVTLAVALVHMSRAGFDFSITGYFTALLADGTLGLAIKGKYDDKTFRGSK